MPGPAAAVSAHADGQAIGGKRLTVIVQLRILRDDLDLIAGFLYLKFRHRKAPVHHNLCHLVGELTVTGILQPEQLRRQYCDPPLRALNHGSVIRFQAVFRNAFLFGIAHLCLLVVCKHAVPRVTGATAAAFGCFR